MKPFNIQANWIADRNKNHHPRFLSSIVVLCLFILQLLITPLTFSNWWHCPMMTGNASVSMPMDMENCMHMQHMQSSNETPQNHHQKSQHGVVLCPLCATFALPSPLLLTGNPELPAMSVMIIAYQAKAYLSQAPPTTTTRNHPPRAPPFFRF